MSKLSARFEVYRAAKSVSGHLIPFSASTAHSAATNVTRAATQRDFRFTINHGIARIAAAIAAQTRVCTTSIATRMFVDDMLQKT